MHSGVLLDTCAAIWLMNGDKMTEESRGAIRTAQESSAGVHVSAITAWEVATLVAKDGLKLAATTEEEWFDRRSIMPRRHIFA